MEDVQATIDRRRGLFDRLLCAAGKLRDEDLEVLIASAEDAAVTRQDDACPGEGRCHGCMSWCDACGDVGAVCDARIGCYVHTCSGCYKHPVARGESGDGDCGDPNCAGNQTTRGR